jgi:hypothetical protein
MPLPAQNLAHPCFPQPGDPSVRVWRYLDLVKLVSMLTRDALPLLRVDTLPDKFEGRYGPNYMRSLNERHQEFLEIVRKRQNLPDNDPFLQAAGEASQALDLRQEAMHRAVTFVSCWNSGPAESEAMWRIYGGSGPAVALTLPYSRLRDSLDGPELFIGSAP